VDSEIVSMHSCCSIAIQFTPECMSNKKLSCRRETARCFVSLNISLSHSRSLKVIENDNVRKLEYGVLCAFHVLYRCRDKARYLSKITIFSFPVFDVPLWNIAIPFGTENTMVNKFDDTCIFSRLDTIPACDRQMGGYHLATA